MLLSVIKYKKPKYPTKIEIDFNSELLKNYRGRWKNSLYAGTIISSLVLTSLTGCSKPVSQSSIKAVSSVAPLFIHGDGVCILKSAFDIIQAPQLSLKNTLYVEKSAYVKNIEYIDMTYQELPEVMLVGNGPNYPTNPGIYEQKVLENFLSESSAKSIVEKEFKKEGYETMKICLITSCFTII